MARFQVTGTSTSPVKQADGSTAPMTTVTLQPDGGTAAQSIRAYGPAGSYIAQMSYGQWYNLNAQAGKYKVAGFNCSEVKQQDSSLAPIYTVIFKLTASGSTRAQDIRLTGPAGSQLANEAMVYNKDFDIIPS